MASATNLENLEYSGISLNMENSGNSVNSVQPQEKNCNKVFLVRHSNISLIDWVNRYIMTLHECHYYIYFLS